MPGTRLPRHWRTRFEVLALPSDLNAPRPTHRFFVPSR